MFEIDQPAPQAWKRRRLTDLGYGVPDWLRLVPVDFEAGASWWDLLAEAGFSPAAPAVVASTGVSMYLTREANAATLRQLAGLAPGSTVAMTFLLPSELLDEQDRPGLAMAANGARAAGTPFISYFSPDEMRRAGPRGRLRGRRGTCRRRSSTPATSPGASDGLRMSTGEDLLVATV